MVKVISKKINELFLTLGGGKALTNPPYFLGISVKRFLFAYILTDFVNVSHVV